MGIKFRCSNGHHLNVKSFLGGRRGICPHCGVKVDIPESAAGGDKTSQSPTAATDQHNSAGAESHDGYTAGQHTPSASAIPVAAPALDVELPTGPQALNHLAPDVSAGNAAPQVSADPIAESPDAVWFVRPVSGGQFGPATGTTLRKWLSEGRVGNESLIWREGWPDWMAAGELFPSLSGGDASPTVAAVEANRQNPTDGRSTNVAPTSTSVDPIQHRTRRYQRRKTRIRSHVAMMVVLISAVVILLPILIYVAMR